ncbi:DUF1236 domain-containing protein [Bradyrhizobium brasilense]|uniref:DUF1236 domain-containing protein n=1 Tax=Bradyrhizobium brasilense TaxID=1419277 RepID=UPI0024B1B2B4|nr:DUF1236 domain-containing protein [Bradyrhizobium australafricanum]WFU34403.1 DUF1236 domain-containing protein [Bradyrhizobium australafricanum]
MRINWLYTTAMALVIGAGPAIAQSPEGSQKREESPRAQSPVSQSRDRPAAQPKEMDRGGATDRIKERAQSEPKAGAKDMQRGEAPSPPERSKEAQKPQGRESKEPIRQSQDQPSRGERAPSSTAQQKDLQQGRDAKPAADQKQQAEEKLRGREGQAKQGRAQEATRPADTKQQQTQQQIDRDRKEQRDQAAQPSTSSPQQSARPADNTQTQKTGQAPDQSNRQTSSAALNDDQRRQVVDQLRRDRTATSQNLNVQVNVGTRLPQGVQARRLPPDIVRIMPQYRDYEYTVIDNRVAIIDPRRREVVDILDDGPGYNRAAAYSRDRAVISDDTRRRLRELVRSSSTTVGSTSPSAGGGTSGSNCLSLQPVPEELARNHPELANYRYLAIGDDVVLVDPHQQKIVQVID